MTAAAVPSRDPGIHQFREGLPSDATAPARARELVRLTLTSWELPGLIGDAELAISELVTNALKHGLPPIVLEIGQSSASLRIAVSDGRPSTAHHEVRVASQDDDESGRGQDIVAAVSDRSGVDRTDVTGKRVYATWDVPRPV
ncbi:MAG: putative regulatory protein phosphatase [Frankiales bacterium]|nr:putative regulatory protein phosphatase [Frankiales bacterium]